MKDIFKIIWTFAKKYIGFVFLGIILIIMFSLMLQKCNDTVEIAEQINLTKYRRELLDSVAKVNHAKQIALIDSLNAHRANEIQKMTNSITQLNKELVGLKNKLKEKEDIHELEDCLEEVGKRDVIIAGQDVVINNKDSILMLHKLTLNDLNKKYDVEHSENIRVRDMYDSCMYDNERLIKALKKKDTWWVKNEKWIFLGAGILGTALILK